MKRIILGLSAWVFSILTISCLSGNPNDLQEISSGSIIKTNINYFYIQKLPDKQTKVPLLLIIDPQGNGEFGVHKFKRLLDDQYGLIIGLNNVKNNTSNYNNLIYKAINDAVQNFQIDRNRIYLAGFSGGARMAFQYAINYSCSGLIMCGAGPGNTNNVNIPFPLVMITGTKDFNFIEQYYPPSLNILKNNNLISLHFKGGHEWPSDSMLVQAYHFIANERKKSINETANCIAKSKRLEETKDYLFSFKQLELAYKISGSSKKEDLNLLLKNQLLNTEFRNYFSELEQNLNEEIQRNRNYIECIESKNMNWWLRELENINKFSEDSSNTLRSDSYARTKAFLGIFLFSKTNNLIHQQGNIELINKTLYIYEKIEPKNPDVYYFKSLNAIINNDTLNSVKYIKQAFNNGFSDSSRLQKDFSQKIIKLFESNKLQVND